MTIFFSSGGDFGVIFSSFDPFFFISYQISLVSGKLHDGIAISRTIAISPNDACVHPPRNPLNSGGVYQQIIILGRQISRATQGSGYDPT